MASQHSSCYGAVINVRYQVHAPHCGLSDVGQPCQPYQPPPAPRRRPSNGVRYAEVRCHSNASLLECDGSPRTACRRIPVGHCWNETPGLCALARTLRRAPARAVEPGTSSGDTGSGCMPGRTHVVAGRAQTGAARFCGFLTQLAGGRPARQTWEAPCHRGGTPRRTVSSRSVPRPGSENAPARFPNQQGDVIERGDPTLPQPGHQVVLGSSRRVVARCGRRPLDQDHRPPLSSRYSRSERRRSRLIA